MASRSEKGEEPPRPAQPRAVGSDSWIGGDMYAEDDRYNAETRKFFGAFKWEVLASIASALRDGVKCSYTEKYSIGQFNMVRRLNFEDGVSWVARIRLPAEATPVELDRYDGRRAFDIEIASMKFFKAKSTIPVPEVFAYDADVSNEAGAPYMLLEYIHGTTADQLENANPSQPWSFGTVEQDRKLRDQMAKIQAEVASFTFSSIGGLYYSEDTETFYIGPDLETGKGPWASSTDYYRDLTDHLLKTTMSRCGHLTTGIPSFALPVLCNHLLGACGEETAGPFRLMNTDFGPHNILVNDGFEIVGIVDFDGMKAAPLEAAAQYPRFSHMTVFPPGYIEAHPLQGPRIEEQKHLLAEYKDCLTRHEVEIRGGDGPAVVGPRLGSTGAIAYDGLLNYGRLARNVNERWFASALLMLKDYAKGLQ